MIGIIIKFLSVTIIISAWASVIRTQYLIPKNKDKIYVCSTIGGAIINLILNILLIKKYGSYGACIGTICAEFFVMIYQTILTRKELEFGKYFIILIKSLLKGCFIIGVAWILSYRINERIIRISVQIGVCIILFIILNYNYIVYEFFNIKKKL